jgi:hypothetical protein
MPATAPANPVSGLLRRLRAIGYDEDFLRRVVLPDWWDDSLAANPASWAQIQFRIAQRLSLPLASVLDPARTLTKPQLGEVRLKRAKSGTDSQKIAPGLIAARNAVRLIVPFLRDLPVLSVDLRAQDLRRWVLERNATVDLGSLLDACWAHGIAVLHFSPLPSLSRKFSGMAYFEDKCPVIVLASGYDEPARLAFHLAHEIAHITLGHVKPGGMILCEASFDDATEDLEEREADSDAMNLLTGLPSLDLKQVQGLTAAKLVIEARRQQLSSGIHAGTFALSYGFDAKRMPVAVNALKLMNMNSGARKIIAGKLGQHLLESGAPNAFSRLPGSVIELLPLFGLDCPA